MVKQVSDNEIYLLIKYIKSVLWRVVKRLSSVEDAQCLKVNVIIKSSTGFEQQRSPSGSLYKQFYGILSCLNYNKAVWIV